MKKVIWTDKELVSLSELMDVQGLVEDYIKTFVANLLYSSSGVVGPPAFTVTVTAPSTVNISAFTGVNDGNLVKTVPTTINVFNSAAVPAIPSVTVIGNLIMDNTTPTRVDLIICQYDGTTLTGDSGVVWSIDTPASATKSSATRNTQTVDSYKWGIVRGTPGSLAPNAIPSGWFKVATVTVPTGLPITVVPEIPLGIISDIMNPSTGHRHFGKVQGDAPKIIHGPHGGITPQSIDPASIGPDDHAPHFQVHNIGGSDHTGYLTNNLHGFLGNVREAYSTAVGSLHKNALHDFSVLTNFDIGATPYSISNSQHGELPAVVGGLTQAGQLHHDATITTAGFMPASDKQKLDNFSSSGLNLYKHKIEHITNFNPWLRIPKSDVLTQGAPVIVNAIIRGYDSGTSQYSQWHTMPFSIARLERHSSGTGQYDRSGGYFTNCNSQIFSDNSNIYFKMQTDETVYGWIPGSSWLNGNITYTFYPLDLTTKSKFYMYALDGTLKNIWDEWEIRYIILTKVEPTI